MKIYNTQQEVEADIVDGVLAIKDDVEFGCDIDIDAHITAENITAENITARDIRAWNITAWNIRALDIAAKALNYYAFCIAYGSIACDSWEGRRQNHLPPTCLDGELTVRGK